MHAAVARGDVAAVETLLAGGADVDQFEHLDTPLFTAVLKRQRECAQVLLSHGADVDHVQGKCRVTPLSRAVWEDDGLTQLLIAHGADVNARDGLGHTPLFDALIHKQLATAAVLIRSGADVNAKGERGRTLLHECRHAATVQFLVDNGARLDSTALVRSLSSQRYEASAELIKNGAVLDEEDARGFFASRHPGALRVLLKFGCPINPRELDSTDDECKAVYEEYTALLQQCAAATRAVVMQQEGMPEAVADLVLQHSFPSYALSP